MTENETIEELKRYRAKSGTEYPEEIEVAIFALDDIQQYRAIGTVEECREARERQRGKKPILATPCKSISYYLCPECREILSIGKPFCCTCGNKIDWSNEDV